jgi:SHS2 domain-containing protein
MTQKVPQNIEFIHLSTMTQKQPDRDPVTILEHSGDLKFRAEGRDFLEALARASEGMVNQIVPLEAVEEREEKPVRAEGEDKPAQAAAFLNELLFLTYARRWLPRRVRTMTRCNRKGCRVIEAVLVGEPWDPERHHSKYEIKAVTYHDLKVETEGAVTTIQFVCDL